MSRHKASVTLLSAERGGRPVMPKDSGYAPHARTPDGRQELPIVLHEVPASATFDTEFQAIVEFRYPDRLDYSPLTSGQDFDLVEGSKRVGRARLHGRV